MSLNNWKPNSTMTLEDLGLENTPPVATENQSEDNKPLVDPPPTDAPEAIVNTDMRPDASTDTSLNDDEIKELPQWAVKINLIEEDGNKLVDMKKVREDIETGGQMNQGVAETIDATFEKFLSPARPVQGFTKNDSKVGLSAAQFFMKQKFQASLEALGQRLEEYIEVEMPQLQDQLQVLKNDQCHDVYTQVRKTISDVEDASCKLADATIVLPFQDQQFINILCDDLYNVDIDKLEQSVPLDQKFRESFSRMQTIWKTTPTVRNMVVAFEQSADTDTDPETLIVGDTKGTLAFGLTLTRLMKAYSSRHADILYESALAQSKLLEDQMAKETLEIQNCQPDDYRNVDFIASRTDQLAAITNSAVSIKGALESVAEFSRCLSCVLCALACLE